jgi:hypothetical protein
MIRLNHALLELLVDKDVIEKILKNGLGEK